MPVDTCSGFLAYFRDPSRYDLVNKLNQAEAESNGKVRFVKEPKFDDAAALRVEAATTRVTGITIANLKLLGYQVLVNGRKVGALGITCFGSATHMAILIATGIVASSAEDVAAIEVLDEVAAKAGMAGFLISAPQGRGNDTTPLVLYSAVHGVYGMALETREVTVIGVKNDGTVDPAMLRTLVRPPRD